MGISISIFSFLLGTIVGSFLNVVALRYNTGLGIQGRSRCFSCNHKLGFFDLVPILSFVASFGRCRYCGSRISFQYPIIEAATGTLFLLTVYSFGFSLHTLYLLPALSLLLVILVYDLKHKIIPNGLVYALIAYSTLPLVFSFETHALNLPSLWHLLAGPILFAPFFFLWFVSRGRWLGLGDGKLAWSFGWLLGLSKGAAAVLLGVWIGAACSLLILAAQKWLFREGSQLTMKSEVPFAPFLILGFLIALFTHVDFFILTSFFEL